MSNPKASELLTTIEHFKGQPILVVGDIIVDRYIWGQVNRISPEAPVPIVEVNKNEDRLGGAGNVVSNLLELGTEVHLAGFLGNDLEGESVKELLKSKAVDGSAIISVDGRPTTLKTRVIAHSQQVVRIDREDASNYDSKIVEALAQAVSKQINKVKAVIISDYGKGAVTEEILKATQGKGVKVVLDPHPKNYSFYRNIDVVKPNRKEAEKAVGFKISSVDLAFKAAKQLQEQWQVDTVLLSLSEDGLIVDSKKLNQSIHLPTVAKDVFDVSGAGDTVTAVYTAALAAGSSLEVAGTLANISAGIVVGEVGVVPITPRQLIAAIE